MPSPLNPSTARILHRHKPRNLPHDPPRLLLYIVWNEMFVRIKAVERSLIGSITLAKMRDIFTGSKPQAMQAALQQSAYEVCLQLKAMSSMGNGQRSEGRHVEQVLLERRDVLILIDEYVGKPILIVLSGLLIVG